MPTLSKCTHKGDMNELGGSIQYWEKLLISWEFGGDFQSSCFSSSIDLFLIISHHQINFPGMTFPNAPICELATWQPWTRPKELNFLPHHIDVSYRAQFEVATSLICSYFCFWMKSVSVVHRLLGLAWPGRLPVVSRLIHLPLCENG